MPETFRKLSGRRGDVDDRARRHRCGEQPPDSVRSKSTAWSCAASMMAHVLDMVEHFRGSGHIVRFIEYMDVGTCNGWRRISSCRAPNCANASPHAGRCCACPPTMAVKSRSATRLPTARGEIGFISSVSEPFCGDCTRARLSADGRLYTCLFANAGHDLRGPMRAGASDAELGSNDRAVWSARDDRYSEMRGQANPCQREACRDVRNRRLILASCAAKE